MTQAVHVVGVGMGMGMIPSGPPLVWPSAPRRPVNCAARPSSARCRAPGWRCNTSWAWVVTLDEKVGA